MTREIIEIDLKQLLKTIKKKWWLLVVLAVTFAIAGFFIAWFTYVPQFTSTATFVVSNKNSQNSGQVENDQISSSDLNASSTLGNTFKYILLSDEALSATIKTYQLNNSISQLKSMISVSPVTGTNILEMSVTTTDALRSKQIADMIISYYPDVLSRTLKTASLEILNSPKEAVAPNQNNDKVLFSTVGFLLGLSLAVVTLLIGEYFGDRLLTSSDINNRLDLNVMVSVPHIGKKKRKGEFKPNLLLTNQASGFPFIETYKALRTKVENISKKKGYKSFIITSTLENEGKTTVAVNLAIALAQNGKSVLLIDGDLRRPSVYKMFGMSGECDELGLSDVLSGERPFQDAVKEIKEYGLFVLPNIDAINNSSELLSTARMKGVIDQASEIYDFVLVDCSPSNLIADSAVLTSYTDGVIFVVRQNYAAASDINTVVQNLTESRAELVGCVFNNVEQADGGSYKGYGKYKNYSSYYAAPKPNETERMQFK